MRLRAAFAAAAAMAARAAAADPLPERGYGMPRDVSLDGFRVDELIHFTLGAIVAIFLVVGVVLAWALVRHGRGHAATYTHGTRRSVAAALIFIGAVALAVDGNLFVHTLVDMNHFFWNFAAAEERPDAVRIEVTAHQWAWAVRYPGSDGKFGTPDDVVLLNDVRVPVGTPVLIQLASNDVIHSFNLPNFRVKQDAVPGMITRLRFQGQLPGEYEIACAQHCGPNHYKMRGILTVLPPDRYRAWLAEAEAMARRGYDPEDQGAHWGWDWRKE